MTLKLNLSTLLLLILAGMCAYVLPFELALIMAGDVMTYLEIVGAVYLLSRTTGAAGLLIVAGEWARTGWERFQIYLAEALVRNVPDFLPTRAAT